MASNADDAPENPMDRLAEVRDGLEILARADVPLSDEAQQALDALDEYEQGGQS